MVHLENKLSTIISQTAAVITATILIGTLLFRTADNIDKLSLIIMVFFLGITVIFSFIGLLLSIKTFNIKNNIYMSGAPSTVDKHSSLKPFLIEQVSDLQKSIDNNVATNNRKGSELIKSYIYLRRSLITLLIAILFYVLGFTLSSLDFSIIEYLKCFFS